MAKTIPTYHRLTHKIRATACKPRSSDYRLLKQVRALARSYEELPDESLPEETHKLREKVQSGVNLHEEEIVTGAFAMALEGIRRTMGLVYYDVQLLAGLALSTGSIAEMKTGEGKTIVAALPASLHALTGQGVHVATVNSYLAERDCELMRAPLELIGFTVGLSQERGSTEQKRAAYQCDITYCTGYELGFDFLRDQVALRSQRKPLLGEGFRDRLRGIERQQVPISQRDHAFAIIDEVDSVLIDEANTPLVLSSADESNSSPEEVYASAAIIAEHLSHGDDFTIDRRKRTLTLTQDGTRKIYDEFEVPIFGLVRPWSVYIEQALRAKHIFRKDVDYVIQDDSIMLVDQYTGRIFADRNWRDGLHQAVECMQGLPISPEKNSVARISRQRYFGLYKTLSGMSGTCTGHERELLEFYNLPIVVIPERIPNKRIQLPSRFFATLHDKWQAIAADVEKRHETGQPVLIGTRTIDESIILATLLDERCVAYQILNGQQNEDEADLVAAAGNAGTVTIATNMAGRGTDIKIDEEAKAAGGLHVIATQRQESSRVDRQLIGRSARAGNPGSCQFFISAEDELIEKHGASVARQIASSANEVGESLKNFESATRNVQKIAENQTLEMRTDLYLQDQWLNEVLMAVAESSTRDLAGV